MPTLRSLETDGDWLSNGLAEVCAASRVIHAPIPFLRDAKAAHELLALLRLQASFLDQLLADDDLPSCIRFNVNPMRAALAPWAPLPLASDTSWRDFNVSLSRFAAVALGIPPSVVSGLLPTKRFARVIPIPEFRAEIEGGLWPELTLEGLDQMLAEDPSLTHMTLQGPGELPVLRSLTAEEAGV